MTRLRLALLGCVMVATPTAYGAAFSLTDEARVRRITLSEITARVQMLGEAYRSPAATAAR